MDNIRAEIRELSTADVVARSFELQEKVKYIADHSSNLKGTFKRDLRLCARATQLCGEELHARAHLPTDALKLRADYSCQLLKISDQEATIMALKQTVEKLTAELNQLRERPRNAPVGTGSIKVGEDHQREELDLRREFRAMEERIMRRLTGTIEHLLGKSRVEDRTAATSARSPSRGPSTRTLRSRPTTGVKAPSAKSLTFSECVRRGLDKGRSMVTSTPCGTDTEDDGEWIRVKRRPRPSKSALQSTDADGTISGAESSRNKSNKKAPKKGKPKVGRVPKTAAVAVTLTPGSGVTMADTIKEAREKIELAGLGIGPGQLRPKRAITGGMLLEVIGEENAKKATELAASMRQVFQDREAIKITVPQKMAEVRITRIDESVTAQEIAAAIAASGGCEVADVRVGEIKFAPYGMGAVWAKCPIASAKKIVALDRLMVGWSATVVTPLQARPLQCYKCLEFGHVQVRCPQKEEKPPKCFRCGREGHIISNCTEEEYNCFLCKGKQYESNHRMGGPYCRTLQESKRRNIQPAPEVKDTAEPVFKKPQGPALKAKKKKAPLEVVFDVSSIERGDFSMDVDA
nr:uncharacterized protein LOC116433941 [Nomia melanderi]